ncbi:hypothetical protein L1887_10999 [Cichorium endivia]|nr:hypothetical protein L1887_10999 [Cichorium endivia]
MAFQLDHTASRLFLRRDASRPSSVTVSLLQSARNTSHCDNFFLVRLGSFNHPSSSNGWLPNCRSLPLSPPPILCANRFTSRINMGKQFSSRLLPQRVYQHV